MDWVERALTCSGCCSSFVTLSLRLLLFLTAGQEQEHKPEEADSYMRPIDHNDLLAILDDASWKDDDDTNGGDVF